ncbi:hypothetical protein KKH03_03190, partial [Patescibacteria group bacterium]|nr:hypothetical protein [Patescibacteria group bacterium]
QNISGFERHINAFSDEDIKNMQNEIKKQYGARLTARKKVSARQMLYLLRDAEYARSGYNNQAQRMKLAFIDADDLIADARNKNLYNSVNNELSEYLGGTTLGSRALNLASKYLKAKFRPEHIFRGQDVIDRITGTVKGMEVFHGLKPDMSRAELQYFADSNGISPLQLKQFKEHMAEGLKGFTMANMEGNVELYDIDSPGMEQLIKMMQRLGSTKASEEAFAHVNQMEGNKHELMIAYLDEYEKKEQQEDKDVIEKIRDKCADWKQWFSRKVLQNTFGERYRDARKLKKEKKMGEGEFQEYLRGNNLLAVGGMMASAVTVAEMAQSARNKANWTWEKVKGGSGWTYDKGSRALGLAWEKALRPLAKNTLVKPVEYLIVKPVKWTAETAWKIAAFPFVFAGSRVKKAWNWAASKEAKAWAWAGGKNPAGG